MPNHEADINSREAPATPGPSKIVVVGPCASGKSTLVQTLVSLGYDAHVSAQEHSAIAALWQHLHPDVLIALEADISAVRARRGADWPEWLHDVQVQRLRDAASAAHLTIDTTNLNPGAVSARVVDFLSARAEG